MADRRRRRKRRPEQPGIPSRREATGRTAGAVRPIASAVVAHGWTLLFWISFRERWEALRDAAAHARARDPEGYIHAPAVKLFRTVRDLVFKDIPANPDHPRFRQGKTLGGAHSHWRRAKFHQRFRLFFRFHSASRTIVYAWLNDENTLRQAGSQTDPYVVFYGMLERGTPPSDWEALMRACEAAKTGESGEEA